MEVFIWLQVWLFVDYVIVIYMFDMVVGIGDVLVLCYQLCCDLVFVVDVDCVGECIVFVFWCGLVVEKVWSDFD